jgi:hypothetical protein
MADEAGKPESSSGSKSSGEETLKPGKESAKRSKAEDNRRMLRIGIVALALIVGVVAWVATSGGDDDGSTTETASAGIEAKIVSVAELEEFADEAGHGVYWAGPLPRKVIELSETAAGNTQIRYLDEGTGAGEGSNAVLTVGSYPLADAAKAFEGFAERKDSISRSSPDGREVAFSLEKPTSVYFTGSDGDVQVEVYDPNYKRAMSLALSDQLRPVG